MNIDEHVNSIVQNIVDQITAQVQQQAMLAVERKITEVISSIDAAPILTNLLSQKLDAKISQLPINTNAIEAELTSRIESMATRITGEMQSQSLKTIKDTVSNFVSNTDFKSVYQGIILDAISTQGVEFPENSISPSALKLNELMITGNQVSSGIIQNFGSTGIDDKATDCRLSIFDEVTVVENNLLTKDLTVKGTATIEGDLNVTGTIPETSSLFINLVNAATNNVRTSLDQTVYQHYSNMVYDQINKNGLDLSRITSNGRDIVDGSNLGTFITGSNLQKVGVLQELQVQGESFLSQTLYTSVKRVGINTIEPTQALSVWDQEVEIGFGKKASNTAVIETPRNHALVLSSNGKNNITLNADGSSTVNKINMGTMSFSVGDRPPSDSQPIGSVVFNSNPSLGGPLGWVSLGDAKWANFGIID